MARLFTVVLAHAGCCAAGRRSHRAIHPLHRPATNASRSDQRHDSTVGPRENGDRWDAMTLSRLRVLVLLPLSSFAAGRDPVST